MLLGIMRVSLAVVYRKDESLKLNVPGAVPQGISELQARLRALQNENGVSRRRVKDLEDEIEKARVEVESAHRLGKHAVTEAINEKSGM
jgi:hypothetical protein